MHVTSPSPLPPQHTRLAYLHTHAHTCANCKGIYKRHIYTVCLIHTHTTALPNNHSHSHNRSHSQSHSHSYRASGLGHY